MITPKVSVIIPTLNSGKTLEKCLKSIRSSVYPPECIELIIVDSGSSDATIRIASRYESIILTDEKRGPTMARIKGLQRATGDVIAFTDGDAIVDPHWIKNLAQHVHESPRTVVGGPLQARDQGDFALAMQSIFELPELLGFSMNHQIVEKEQEVLMLPTANFAVSSNAVGILESVAWDGYGGDFMLSKKLHEAGYVLKAFPDVRVQHLKRGSPVEVIVEMFKWGSGHVQKPKKILGRAMNTFIPLSIAYFTLASAAFGMKGLGLATMVACIPFAVEAVWAGVRNASLRVMLWSPIALLSYMIGWSAGCIFAVVRRSSRARKH